MKNNHILKLIALIVFTAIGTFVLALNSGIYQIYTNLLGAFLFGLVGFTYHSFVLGNSEDIEIEKSSLETM